MGSTPPLGFRSTNGHRRSPALRRVYYNPNPSLGLDFLSINALSGKSLAEETDGMDALQKAVLYTVVAEADPIDVVEGSAVEEADDPVEGPEPIVVVVGSAVAEADDPVEGPEPIVVVVGSAVAEADDPVEGPEPIVVVVGSAVAEADDPVEGPEPIVVVVGSAVAEADDPVEGPEPIVVVVGSTVAEADDPVEGPEPIVVVVGSAVAEADDPVEGSAVPEAEPIDVVVGSAVALDDDAIEVLQGSVVGDVEAIDVVEGTVVALTEQAVVVPYTLEVVAATEVVMPVHSVTVTVTVTTEAGVLRVAVTVVGLPVVIVGSTETVPVVSPVVAPTVVGYAEVVPPVVTVAVGTSKQELGNEKMELAAREEWLRCPKKNVGEVAVAVVEELKDVGTVDVPGKKVGHTKVEFAPGVDNVLVPTDVADELKTDVLNSTVVVGYSLCTKAAQWPGKQD
ncbi:hypothetical protein A0H81_09593 [Grifola frondosa]|uniref:Uncharacterized protein n=1 Tax=Grifola frondosa TaxID=5627 RepID=A0A1C7M087_GRIFR|nr:hypothetical protein A0H81_09593 [Grifola frondosa]